MVEIPLQQPTKVSIQTEGLGKHAKLIDNSNDTRSALSHPVLMTDAHHLLHQQVKLHEQEVMQVLQILVLLLFIFLEDGHRIKKKKYTNTSKFQMFKNMINRRLLVVKENIQQALRCTALNTMGHGQWDALMEL